MRFTRLFAFVLAACVGVSAAAPAGTFAEMTFPKGIGAQISIRSTKRLLNAVDAAVAASSKGMEEPLDEGFILGMVAMGAPFLAGDDALDLEVHLLLPPVMNQMAIMGAVLIIGNAEFDQLVSALLRVGVPVTVVKENERFTATFGNSPPFTFENIGNGYFVCAMQPNAGQLYRKEMEDGWRPALWMDGDVGLVVNVPGRWMLNQVSLAPKMALLRRWVGDANNPALEGVDRDVLGRMLDEIDALGAWAKEELVKTARLGLDIRLDGERLGVALRAKSEEGTLIAQIGEAASSRSNFRSSLDRDVRADAVQLVTQAPFVEVVPDLEERLNTWLERAAANVFPRSAGELTSAYRAYWAARPTANVSSAAFPGVRFDSSTWFGADDPDALLAATRTFVTAMNAAYRELMPFLGDRDAMNITDEALPDGARYIRVVWDEEANLKVFNLSTAIAALLSGQAPVERTVPEWMRSPVLLYGVRDDSMVGVAGANPEKLLAAALQGGEDDDGAFVNLPSAQTAMADLKYRQNTLLLLNYGFLTRFIVEANMTRGQTPEDAAAKLDELEPLLLKPDSLVGLSLGGSDGCVVGDFYLPTETVSALIHNFNLLEKHKLTPQTPEQARLVNQRDSSRVRANEASAITALKMYATAQITFNIGKQWRAEQNTNASEGYVDNFRNLYYGVVWKNEDSRLELISQRMADAFAGPTLGAPTVGDATEEAKPYNGYLFLEPPGFDFSEEFGLIAYPVNYGSSGFRVFCVDVDGDIWVMSLDKRPGGSPRPGTMPELVGEDETLYGNLDLWEVLDD